MADSLTQQFLRGKGSLAALEEFYAVYAKRHPKFPNLVHLKYDQLEAHAKSCWDQKITLECRSMILDEDDDWRCVARSFDRFFNQGEPQAASIMWNSAIVQEKIDGSLCLLYYYRGDWHVATSGRPDAGGPVGPNAAKTLRDLFWEVWHEEGYDYPLRQDVCFTFELTTPENRVVMPHVLRQLTVLGARDLNTQQELYPASIARILPLVRQVKTFDISLKDVDKFEGEFDKEGYVVVDAQFNRIKVKDPRYVQLHRAKDGFSDRAMWEIALQGEDAEITSYFPEFKAQFEGIVADLNAAKKRIKQTYTEIGSCATQKDFAFKAVLYPYAPVLFALRKGTANSNGAGYASAMASAVDAFFKTASVDYARQLVKESLK